MNLKFNIWTILFAICLGYILGEKFISKEKSEPEKPILEARFNVSDTLFRTRYEAYQDRYLPVVNNPVLNLKDSVQVDTLGMLYWLMTPDEVVEMVDKINELNTLENHPEVRIYPTIHDTQETSEMDLIFEILDPSTRTASYYDFTKPCPPTCGSGNSSQ